MSTMTTVLTTIFSQTVSKKRLTDPTLDHIMYIQTNKEGNNMFDSRDAALALVEEGVVSAEAMLTMALKYMSTDDVEDMLDCNELSDRFLEDEEDEEEFLVDEY